MISPEVLRRYPFFSGLNEESIKSIAMAAEEIEFASGECFYKNDQAADSIYLLIKGNVENYLVIADREYPNIHKEFYLGDVNPGDVFGLSGMIEPFTHSTTTRANRPGSAVKLNAKELRRMCDEDPKFGYLVLQHLSKALKDRLQHTRVQLAATRGN
jgi:CRP/FNR family transcriptional regulator, cyclic AMP receptor protein